MSYQKAARAAPAIAGSDPRINERLDGGSSSVSTTSPHDAEAANRTRLRFLAARLHALGPKPMFHFLDELVRCLLPCTDAQIFNFQTGFCRYCRCPFQASLKNFRLSIAPPPEPDETRIEERKALAMDSVPEPYLDAWARLQVQRLVHVTVEQWRQAIVPDDLMSALDHELEAADVSEGRPVIS